DRADAYPDSMSGGEQRRVAVARALINAPPLLLADEPTSDLDEDTETGIIDLFEDLQRIESFGFVLVTHDLKLAKRAERCFEMRQGTVAPSDLPQIEAVARRRAGPAGLDAARPEQAGHAPIRLGRSPCRRPSAFLAPPPLV